MLQYFEYYKECPGLLPKLLKYFDMNNKTDLKERTISNFCTDSNGKVMYQPAVVDWICKRLCEKGLFSCIRDGSILGLKNIYAYCPVGRLTDEKAYYWEYTLNAMVYGFRYIYEANKENVLPLVWERGNGDYSAGTGFKYRGGIVTAKHCIVDAKNLKIKNYKADFIQGKNIYVSEDDAVDIAFIDLNENTSIGLLSNRAEVLDEVIVMGYPRIPAFTDFLTAEKATISSKAESRITPSIGSVAARGYEFLTKSEALLITAKVGGGNSGGPVINSDGYLVGVMSHVPNYDGDIGDYDNLGYGVAIPVNIVDDIINNKVTTIAYTGEFLDW